MIVGIVGTTPMGFSQLVEAIDDVCRSLCIEGFIQIGNSAYLPKVAAFERFLPRHELLERLRRCDLAITHGGIGAIGDSLRHAPRLVVVARPLGTSRAERVALPDDQGPVAERLGALYGFPVVTDRKDLKGTVQRAIVRPVRTTGMPISPIPGMIEDILAGRSAPGLPPTAKLKIAKRMFMFRRKVEP